MTLAPGAARDGRIRQPSPKPPFAYRPDLRPMLILAGLLLAVVVGWMILSPIILPASGDDATGPLAGTWTLDRDAPDTSTLALGSGVYRLEGTVDFAGRGTAAFRDEELTVGGDPACPDAIGRYSVRLGEVDRYGLPDEFRAQTMTLAAEGDPCAAGQRAAALGRTWILRSSQRAEVHGVCDPPNPEAAVTGHWPVPTGC